MWRGSSLRRLRDRAGSQMLRLRADPVGRGHRGQTPVPRLRSTCLILQACLKAVRKLIFCAQLAELTGSAIMNVQFIFSEAIECMPVDILGIIQEYWIWCTNLTPKFCGKYIYRELAPSDSCIQKTIDTINAMNPVRGDTALIIANKSNSMFGNMHFISGRGATLQTHRLSPEVIGEYIWCLGNLAAVGHAVSPPVPLSDLSMELDNDMLGYNEDEDVKMRIAFSEEVSKMLADDLMPLITLRDRYFDRTFTITDFSYYVTHGALMIVPGLKDNKEIVCRNSFARIRLSEDRLTSPGFRRLFGNVETVFVTTTDSESSILMSKDPKSG
jgi:hypothetical protein